MPAARDADPPSPNAHIEAVPKYQPGRSAEALMAEHGLTSAVKLASNEIPFGVLPGVAEAIARAVAGLNRYADHTASAVAERFAEHVGVPRAHVGVGPGSVGLLEQLALAFAGPGAEVLYPWPSFIAYPQFTQLADATPVPVPLRRQTFDVDAILAAATDRTRLVLLANPNNPTSTALRTGELRRLVDGLPESALVVVDEAYHEFVTGADVPDAIREFADRPNVAVLRTLSKAYSLAGLRIGFIVAHPEVVRAVDAALIPFAVNGLAQAAALAALRHGDVVAERCALITSERERVTRAMRDRRLGVPESQANFLWLPAGERAARLSHELERSGVATRALGPGIRVTVGLPDENDRFLAAFDRAVAQHPELTDAWELPTGEQAEAATHWLARADAVLARLRHHVVSDHAGLTRPAPGATERLDAGQVWAHLGEVGEYGLGEVGHVLSVGSAAPTAFGRTTDDRQRLAAIERGRDEDPYRHLVRVERSLDRLRALLGVLSVADWSRLGQHPTLGVMSVDGMLDTLLVGHYEQHASQLDELERRRGPGGAPIRSR